MRRPSRPIFLPNAVANAAAVAGAASILERLRGRQKRILLELNHRELNHQAGAGIYSAASL
jgi:hypothetical protein